MAMRKITVEIPEELLQEAQRYTGKGITSTIRHGLKLAAAGSAYAKIRSMRGKVKFSLSLDEIRKDRN